MELSAHLQPPLTTVTTDVVAWGRAAATRLLALIHGTEPPDVELPPARLVVRGLDRATRPLLNPTATPRTHHLNGAPMRSKILAVSLTTLALGLTAACGGGGGSSDAESATGDIKVWLSNNPEEIAWGKAMVADWNKANPDEKVTAQEIPAGKTSEEVIGAAITAGNAPCLVFNTSPAAVPQFQKQGGLVALDDFSDGTDYVEDRSGDAADQYTSPDGKFYQIPWKQNPVMIFYNKDLMKKAGVDPAEPPLSTYDDFLATSKKIVDSGAADYAIAPAPTSEFFQSWFDFYPLYAAASGGQQTIEDGKATFDDTAGKDVWDFWSQMYADGYSPKEAYNGDSFADGKSAMAVVGPWAVAVYGDKVNWGVAPVPTKDGHGPERGLHLQRREEHRALLGLREPEDRVGRAEVRDQRGAGRPAAGDDRPDADPRRPGRDLPRLLRLAPRLHDLRRPGRPHRRGAQRAQLGRDLAGDPRRVLVRGDLRQDQRRRGAHAVGRQGQRARRRVVTGPSGRAGGQR